MYNISNQISGILSKIPTVWQHSNEIPTLQNSKNTLKMLKVKRRDCRATSRIVHSVHSTILFFFFRADDNYRWLFCCVRTTGLFHAHLTPFLTPILIMYYLQAINQLINDFFFKIGLMNFCNNFFGNKNMFVSILPQTEAFITLGYLYCIFDDLILCV